MFRRISLIVVLAFLMGWDTSAQQNQLVITSVTSDATTLYISGANFKRPGSDRREDREREREDSGNPTNPTVYLNGAPIVSVVNAAGTQIMAQLPVLPPGSYLLLVTRGSGSTVNATFIVTIGGMGPKGPKGDTGLTGLTGAPGDPGATGPAGATGPPGPTGPIGPTGATGAIGPIGPMGPAGPQGPQGAPGFNGLNGAPGAPGTIGPAGPAGPQGATGADPFASISCPAGQAVVAFALNPIQVKCAVVPELLGTGIVPSNLQTYTDRVITVSQDPTNRNTPHPTFNGSQTIFKAIARNCNAPVVYSWDFGDGTFSGDITTNNRYNLSTSHVYPIGYEDTAYNAAITLVSCAGVIEAANNQAMYPVMQYGTILADQADLIRNAPESNIDLTATYTANGLGKQWRKRMSDKAIEDGLWSLHNGVTNRAGEGTAIMTGNMGGILVADVGIAMTAMQQRKHMAAYPPGTYPAGDPVPSPTWRTDNDLRYASDPYAEDLLRMFNSNLSQMGVVSVAAVDEGDDAKTPIPGTNDLIGLTFGINEQNAYYTGIAAGALATSGMAGTAAQVGDLNRVRGRTIEFIAQQTVDFMNWFQNDVGASLGSFYYTPNANTDDGSTSQWMYYGLWVMDKYMSPYGVITATERLKGRLAAYLRASQHTVPPGTVSASHPYGAGATSYTMGATNNYAFQLSAGPLVAMAMMGWQNPTWENNNGLASLDFSAGPVTRGQAYITYRKQFDYIGDDWNGTGGNDQNGNWGQGQWAGGVGGYLRNDNDYNLYSIQWAAKAMSALGATCVGGTEAQDANGVCTDGNDWKHQHTTLLVRRQTVTTSGSMWTSTRGFAVLSMTQSMKTAMAIITLELAQ
jgi:hypothetical protein